MTAVKTTLKGSLKRTLKVLEDLQWCGTTLGPGTNMWSNDGYRHQSCPICFGLRPTAAVMSEFSETSIGHMDNCKLVKEIKAIKKNIA